jgi:hypothetical protein
VLDFAAPAVATVLPAKSAIAYRSTSFFTVLRAILGNF